MIRYGRSLSLIALPFRIWKPLIGLLFILIIALFVIGFGGGSSSNKCFGPGSIPFIALDLVTLLVLAAITFRLVTNPLIIHFGIWPAKPTARPASPPTRKRPPSPTPIPAR